LGEKELNTYCDILTEPSGNPVPVIPTTSTTKRVGAKPDCLLWTGANFPSSLLSAAEAPFAEVEDEAPFDEAEAEAPFRAEIALFDFR
jgi:hypothetical protein